MDYQKPSYISYRTQSDFFEVAFYGGPLDGQTIITDVYPDNDEFVHYVNGRVYVYRYRSVDLKQFRADLAGFDPPTRPVEKRGFFAWLMRLFTRAKS